MARIAGRRGRVYLAVTSGGEAEPLPFVATWSMNFATNKINVTAMEDSNTTYVSGLADVTGQFSGFYDDASAQTYTAAVDGLPRKFYLYPSLLNTTTYFFGKILPDFNLEGGVDAAVTFSASWNAASDIVKIG